MADRENLEEKVENDSEQRYCADPSAPGMFFEIAGELMRIFGLSKISKFSYKIASYLHSVKGDYYTSAMCAEYAGNIKKAAASYFNVSSEDCPVKSNKGFKKFVFDKAVNLCLENNLPKTAIKFLFMRDEFKRAAELAEKNNLLETAYVIYDCAIKASNNQWEKGDFALRESEIKDNLKKDISANDYIRYIISIYTDTELKNAKILV